MCPLPPRSPRTRQRPRPLAATGREDSLLSADGRLLRGDDRGPGQTPLQRWAYCRGSSRLAMPSSHTSRTSGSSSGRCGLAVFYPHPRVALPMWKVAAALSGVGRHLAAMVLVYWRRRPYLLVGWLWFLGMLVPVIGLVQVGIHAMADRYTYLPQIGLCAAVAWLADARVFAARAPARRDACAFISTCVSGPAGRTDGRRLASDDFLAGRRHDLGPGLACTSRNELRHNNLATFWGTTAVLTRLSKHYRQALKIRHDLPEAHNNLGSLLLDRGQLDQSIAECRQALEIRPDYVGARLNLGNALAARGLVDEAIFQDRRRAGDTARLREGPHKSG